MDEIFEIVEKIIKEGLYFSGDVDYDTNLLVEFDELDIVELCMRIEDEFDIEFTDEEYDNINNVGKLVELIHKKIRLSLIFICLHLRSLE